MNYPAEDIMATDRPKALRLRYGLGHREMEPAVRTGPVVLLDVVAENRLELTARNGEELVQALPTDCPHPAFSELVGPGAWTGVRAASMPAEAITASKLTVNLVSRSRTKKRKR